MNDTLDMNVKAHLERVMGGLKCRTALRDATLSLLHDSLVMFDTFCASADTHYKSEENWCASRALLGAAFACDTCIPCLCAPTSRCERRARNSVLVVRKRKIDADCDDNSAASTSSSLSYTPASPKQSSTPIFHLSAMHKDVLRFLFSPYTLRVPHLWYLLVNVRFRSALNFLLRLDLKRTLRHFTYTISRGMYHKMEPGTLTSAENAFRERYGDALDDFATFMVPETPTCAHLVGKFGELYQRAGTATQTEQMEQFFECVVGGACVQLPLGSPFERRSTVALAALFAREEMRRMRIPHWFEKVNLKACTSADCSDAKHAHLRDGATSAHELFSPLRQNAHIKRRRVRSDTRAELSFSDSQSSPAPATVRTQLTQTPKTPLYEYIFR